MTRLGFGFGVGLVAAGASVGCRDAHPSAAAIDAGLGARAIPNVAADASGSTLPTPVAPLALPTGVARVPAATISPASLKAAVASNNAFASALFGQLRAQSAGKNLLTSPISASLALSMACAGATGRTRAEMATALHFGAQAASAIFEGQNALIQALLARGPQALALESNKPRGSAAPLLASDYTLQIVNSVWGEASAKWERPFLNTLAADYGTSVYARDFRQQWEPARLEINAWVLAQTNGKIQDLLPSSAVASDTRLVLVNALHLKFPWRAAFEPSATDTRPFTRADRKEISASVMHQQAQLAYLDDGAAQIVALPLIGQQLSVIVALPHVGVALAEYERSLQGNSPALAEPVKSALIALSLPKVTFTSPSFSLSDTLHRLGMVQAFDPSHAQFEGMSAKQPPDERLYVGDVLQKATISMAETGVEAAAATAIPTAAAVSAPQNSQPPPVPIPMVVNRPYLVAVVDVPTGAVLLLGQINDPSDAGG